ncbi:MAG: hypothetical protein AB2705_12855 [Candidatus Thiodiazotropha sp.]
MAAGEWRQAGETVGFGRRNRSPFKALAGLGECLARLSRRFLRG